MRALVSHWWVTAFLPLFATLIACPARAEINVSATLSYTGGSSSTLASLSSVAGLAGADTQNTTVAITMRDGQESDYIAFISGNFTSFSINFSTPPAYDTFINGVRRNTITFTNNINDPNWAGGSGYTKTLNVRLVRRVLHGPGNAQPLGESSSIAWGDFSYINSPPGIYYWPYVKFNLGAGYNGDGLLELQIPLHPRNLSSSDPRIFDDDIVPPNEPDVAYAPDGACGFTLHAPQLDARLTTDSSGNFSLKFYPPGGVTAFVTYAFSFPTWTMTSPGNAVVTITKTIGSSIYDTKLSGPFGQGLGVVGNWTMEDWHKDGLTALRTLQGEWHQQQLTSLFLANGWYPFWRYWTIVSTYEGSTLVSKKRYDYKLYENYYYSSEEIKTTFLFQQEKVTDGYDGPNYVTWLLPQNNDSTNYPFSDSRSIVVQPDGRTHLEQPLIETGDGGAVHPGKIVYETWRDASPQLASDPAFTLTENSSAKTVTAYSIDVRWSDFNWPSSIKTTVGSDTFADATISYDITTANGADVSVATRLDRQSAGGDGLSTVTKRYFPNVSSAVLCDRLYSVQHPDGTKISYAYETGTFNGSTFTAGTGSDVQVSTLYGTATAGDTPVGVQQTTCGTASIDPIYLKANRSTKTVEILQNGFVVRREMHIFNGTAFESVSWETFGYTTDGRQNSHTSSNGASTTVTWSDAVKDHEVDEAGITTSYTYDALDRVQTATRSASGTMPALRTKYTYNADTSGTTYQTKTETGPVGDAHPLTSIQQFDTGGKISTSTAPGNVVTSYSYANGGLTTTVVSASGSSEASQVVTVNFIDGRKKSVTGNGTVAEYHDYDFASGNLVHTVRLADPTSGRMRQETLDLLGRVLKEKTNGFGDNGAARPIVADHYYNTKGQLWKSTTYEQASTGNTSLSADKLINYDDFGAMKSSGLDLSTGASDTTPDGILTAASKDRYTETATIFEKNSGDWWSTVTTTLYYADGLTSNYQSSVKTRLSGFTGNVQSEVVTSDFFGRTTTEKVTYSTSGTRTRSVSRPDSSSVVTTTRAGLVESVEERDSSGSSIHSTSNTYDDHGRLSMVTDSRNGAAATTTYKDGTARVDQQKDADGNVVFTYGYDGAGRVSSKTDANSDVVSSLYNTRGQLTQVSGTGAYPMVNGYNDYGERTSLTTYRNGLDQPGDSTTWSFDTNTGWLASKKDAADKIATFDYSYESGEKLVKRKVRGITTTSHYTLMTGDLAQVEYDDGVTPGISYSDYTRTAKPGSVSDATGTRDFIYDTEQLATEALDPSWYFNLVLTTDHEGSTSVSGHTLIGRYSGIRLGSLTTPAQVMKAAYSYDSDGRIGGVTATWPNSVSRQLTYRYLSSSTPWDKVYDDSFSLERDFEPNRTVINAVIADFGSSTVTDFDYLVNVAGQRQSIRQSGSAYADYGDAIHWKYGYDSRGEIQSAQAYFGTDTTSTAQPLPGLGLGFTYDTAGNRKTAAVDTETVNYTDGSGNPGGNALNQIKTRGTLHAHVSGTANASATVTVSGNGTVSASRQGIWFDAVAPVDFGNYVQVTTSASVSGQTDTDQRAIAQPQSSENFGYDDDGNLTLDGRWSYAYDAENRLTSLSSLNPDTQQPLITGRPLSRSPSPTTIWAGASERP